MKGWKKGIVNKTITLIISIFAGNNSDLQSFGTLIVISKGRTKVKIKR
jgi:hypothetical protein